MDEHSLRARLPGLHLPRAQSTPPHFSETSLCPKTDMGQPQLHFGACCASPRTSLALALAGIALTHLEAGVDEAGVALQLAVKTAARWAPTTVKRRGDLATMGSQTVPAGRWPRSTHSLRSGTKWKHRLTLPPSGERQVGGLNPSFSQPSQLSLPSVWIPMAIERPATDAKHDRHSLQQRQNW